MTPRGTWDSPEAGKCRCTAATGKARTAGKDPRMLLHDCRSPMAARLSPRRLRPPTSPALTCITLALLLCSLVQLAVASIQLPGSSSPTSQLTPRLQDHSQTFTHHTFLRNTAVPLSNEAPRAQRISAAGERRQNPPEAVTATPTTEAPPSHRAAEDLPHAHARATRSITKMRRVELHGPPVVNRKTVFVEVVVLADNSFFRHYQYRNRAQHHITQVIGVANMVLRGVGVVLVPTEVELWDRGDKIQVTSRLETNVNNLQQHRLTLLRQQYPNDHTVLLTRKQMQGQGSCGAPLRGMCKKKESVSVVQDEDEGPGVTGVALAHQVGHSLGMEDDAEDPNHACRCAASICVMSRHYRNSSNQSLDWSACSKQSLDSAMGQLALDCLRNVPTRIHSQSNCGDGVVDEGEQCDCGPPGFCDNPCCVAATCRLANHASCASGSCCDIQTCQPKSPGVMCRAAATECDLPEFCSGHSEYCPRDVTKADGIPCREGYCFNGECGSREGQCQRMTGSSASASSPDCYTQLNIGGTHAGNCGMRRVGALKRCQKEDAVCGTLHCRAPVLPSHLLPHHLNGSESVGTHKCHFISGSKEYPAHHWLTPSGAPCGPGKMCMNQKCKKVPRLAGDCRDGCSGNGVCNSLGHCHCNAGFSPPTCSLPGLGGSVDSNVMSDASDSRLLILVAWVVMVLLLSLLALTCCSWGFFKGWYKRKGRDNISQVLPCCTACLDACCCPVMTKTARWMLTVGSSPEKKTLNRNIEVEEEANEHMLCSVDVDIKGTSQTNSWGMASGKLVTDIVTITPKDSPDLRRKVKLASESPILHHKSEENLSRPKYLQSISTDSGCVSDTDDDSPNKRSSLQLSMSSLLSTLMKFGDKKSKTTLENETHPSKSFGSQKSIPLSRFVVDPLAGRRSSRHATPPPEHVRPDYKRSYSTDVISNGRYRGGTPPPAPESDRPAYNRSFSTDIVSTGGNRKEGTPPPPPPPGLKPNKSEDNLSTASEMPSRGRHPYRQHTPPADVSSGENRIGGTPPPPPPPPPGLKPNKSEDNLSTASEMPSHGRHPYRQHTPPADVSNGENRIGGTPPPPPPPPHPGLKPNKREENQSKASEMPGGSKLPNRKHSPPADAPAPPKKYIQKDDNREATPTTACKVPLIPAKNKPLPSPPKVPPVHMKNSSPPRTGSQRYPGGKDHEKSFPTSGAVRQSPPKTSSDSNKIMEMTRKFEAA